MTCEIKGCRETVDGELLIVKRDTFLVILSKWRTLTNLRLCDDHLSEILDLAWTMRQNGSPSQSRK